MRVFVSHSPDDRYFVSLLEALLEFHGLRTESGSGEPDGTVSAIRESDALVAVLSRNSARSNRVAEEIAAFEAHRAGAPSIRILLEPAGASEDAGASVSERIDFSRCMRTGFERLLSCLGRRFLDADRRIGEDRRDGKDRRESGALRRMRVGFILSYCRQTQRSPVETLAPYLDDPRTLRATLQEEAKRYEYRDRATGTRLHPMAVLEGGIARVWQTTTDLERREVSLLFHAIAREICELHEVTVADRRRVDRRESDRTVDAEVAVPVDA